MHHIEGDDYRIERLYNEYRFSGLMLCPDYKDVKTFFETTVIEVAEETIIFDFENLEYLNTAGIKILSHVITGLPETKKVRIKINEALPWQATSVQGFAMISPDKVELNHIKEGE